MFSQGQNFEKLALSNCPWRKENPKTGRKLVTYRVKVVELKKRKEKKKKKGWQEYTKELFKKDHDLDDHDGVVTHLEPDNLYYDYIVWGFPSGSDSNQSAYNAGESACKAGLIPGSGRTLEKGMQYSCSENTMHR